MKTRNKIIRWWLLASLSMGPVLISCANSNVEETADADAEAYEETVTDNSDSGMEGGEEVAENSDSTGFDDAATESSNPEETVASNDAAPKEAGGDFEPLANDDFENLSFDEQGAQSAENTQAAPAESSTPPAETSTGMDDSSLFGSTADTAPATTETPSSDFGLGSSPALEDPVSTASTEPKIKTFRASVMPKIPTDAINKQGSSLNRYYFLRKGDTPNAVAKKLYGEENRAEDLTAWNSTAWVPGNLIYFVSPSDAGDPAMRSIYEEREVKPSTVKVKRGESISQIALKRLGHVNSWKELAVVNQLDRPDSLTKGQSLKYFEDLGEAPAPQVAAAPVVPPPAPVVPPPPPAPVVPPPPAMAEMPKPVIENKPKALERRDKGTDVNLSKLLKQNLFFITMGLGVGLLLLALVAINRRKKDSAPGGEEFNEDAFAPPRKKRR